MDASELEARLLELDAKLNKLLERETQTEEVELVSPEDVPEKVTLNIPPGTVPRRLQLDLVLMGGSRPRRELTLDLVLMGGSRPRSEKPFEEPSEESV
jgi:hypothetical protein